MDRSDISWLLTKLLGLFMLIYVIISIPVILSEYTTFLLWQDLHDMIPMLEDADNIGNGSSELDNESFVKGMKALKDYINSNQEIKYYGISFYLYIAFNFIFLILGCYLFIDGRIVTSIIMRKPNLPNSS